jgi:hypothetical protein
LHLFPQQHFTVQFDLCNWSTKPCSEFLGLGKHTIMLLLGCRIFLGSMMMMIILWNHHHHHHLMKSLSYEAAPSDFWMHIFSPMHRSANPVQHNPKGTIPWVCETNFDSLDWWSFWHMKVTSATEIYAAAVADDDDNDLTNHQSYTLPWCANPSQAILSTNPSCSSNSTVHAENAIGTHTNSSTFSLKKMENLLNSLHWFPGCLCDT